MNHLEHESKENKIDNQQGNNTWRPRKKRRSRGEATWIVFRELEDTWQSSQKKLATQEYIRCMAREFKRWIEGLSGNEDDSTDSSEETSSERRRGEYEELVREFPEIMELVEEERKERERKETQRSNWETRNARADRI